MYSQDFSFTVPSSSKDNPRPPKRWYQKWWGRVILALLFLILVMIVAVGFYIARTAYDLASGRVTPEQLFGSNPEYQRVSSETYATSDDPSFGSRDAKIVIVEFSDFQCPFCKEASAVVNQIKKNYSDRVLFIYRDFPIESIHPQAVTAAAAAACAHEQGYFWEMHDRIFENQSDLSEDNLKRLAIQVGLNSIQFGSCFDGRKYFSEIESDFQDGLNAGITATPTFFINGRMVEGAIPYSLFEQIILDELSH
jgi:protein-disulfide isomerase